MQGAGAFGEAAAGGARYLARLLRSGSAASAFPGGGRLLPCPRGSLADLKFVPLNKHDPGPGEIKVLALAFLRLPCNPLWCRPEFATSSLHETSLPS
jgi:hypothetical protein